MAGPWVPKFFQISTFVKLLVARCALADEETGGGSSLKIEKRIPAEDESTARAKWLAEQLRFRLMESMAQRGGSEAFLQFMRSDDGKPV